MKVLFPTHAILYAFKHFTYNCSALAQDHDNYLCVQDLEFLLLCCYKLSLLRCCAVTLDK